VRPATRHLQPKNYSRGASFQPADQSRRAFVAPSSVYTGQPEVNTIYIALILPRGLPRRV
jgi:hypothetical protein